MAEPVIGCATKWRPWVLCEVKLCIYCGNLATGVDHVPPQSARANMTALGIRAAFVEVAACRECNSALGYKAIWTLPERGRYIKRWLKARYRRCLAMPNWTPEELAPLGPFLRQRVEEGLRARQRARDRIAWPVHTAVWISYLRAPGNASARTAVAGGTGSTGERVSLWRD